MKYLTDINRTEQPLRYNKVMMQQKAYQILSKNGNSKRQDNLNILSISDTARSFSKESVVALVDSSANISKNQVSFYLKNYNNMSALLDAINFGENVSCGYNPDFKDYGVFYFDHNGSSQIIPNYAVPKINAGSLPQICAVNNSLVLSNKSYYSWTTSDGSRYTWTVTNGGMRWALSESLLDEPGNQKGINYEWEMRKASNILSALARGKTLYGFSREDILSACESVGFKPGFFSIDAGSGVHNYILQESGRIINADEEIKRLNSRNWINAGFKEGDTVSVYGNDYIVDSNGHINVSAEDTFTSTEVMF